MSVRSAVVLAAVLAYAVAAWCAYAVVAERVL